MIRLAKEEKARRILERQQVEPKLKVLWPDRYLSDTPETFFKFATECCWTFDEETSQVALIPQAEHVEFYCHLWWNSRHTGKALVTEKSRRQLISWVDRACMLCAMGQRAEVRVIAGLTLPKAADHTWRMAWLYREARTRLWRNLPDCRTRATQDGGYEEHKSSSVTLPNGSLVTALNQESDTYQGSGYAGVVLEEFSLFKRCARMWGQSHAVTKGRADVIGGHVVAIVNADPSAEYKEIKKLKKVLANYDPTWRP